MKIRSIRLQNFKKFQDYTVNFVDPELGITQDLAVLVGDNGCGKSTVLQAIAAIVGTATGRLESPKQLQWPGFDFSLVNRGWDKPADVRVEIEFSKAEIETFYDYKAKGKISLWKEPINTPSLSLTFNGTYISNMMNGNPPLSLIRQHIEAEGYFETLELSDKQKQHEGEKHSNNTIKTLNDLGSVYWYHDHRHTTDLIHENDPEGNPIQLDENILRRRLANWWGVHLAILTGNYSLKPGETDSYQRFKEVYGSVFPGRTPLASVPKSGSRFMEDPWFMFSYEGQEYELGELSAGERAVFPILLDFAYWDINNSIILIDELELHLHPPMQQGLLRALRRMGKNNQFIITTHSRSVANVVSSSNMIRLD